ncbi:hypothetical protein [Microbacterium hominis]|uniref:hypothetical protein n=1 Tax=Microbacterium hominis TaxID=162426 RepID=UPI0021DFBC7F|nr:hypothetical protein [Microbacterium hominis]
MAASAGVNTAVSECPPTLSAEVITCAEPAATATEPSDTEPSKNSTAPDAAGVTVAVSATLVPDTADPLGDTVRVVVVAVGGNSASQSMVTAVRASRFDADGNERDGHAITSYAVALSSFAAVCVRVPATLPPASTTASVFGVLAWSTS